MGVPVGCKSKWAQLPPTSLPSSFLHCVFILSIPFFHLLYSFSISLLRFSSYVLWLRPPLMLRGPE